MRIGLALSGGGVRGIAHVGLIKALNEHDIQVTDYIGVSAGAIVGVLVAAGCSIQEMLDFWIETNPFSIKNLAFGEPALFNTLSYVNPIKRYVKVDTFEELQHNLTVCASAMLSGELHFFNSGKLWPIVLASATFPIVFSPIEWKDEIYMDGGIIDNFPVEPLANTCDFVIGVNVDPHRTIEKEDLQKVRDVIERVMDLRFQDNSNIKASYCDVLIHPPRIEEFSTFQTGSMLEIFQLGYEAGLQAIPEIKAKIKNCLVDSTNAS